MTDHALALNATLHGFTVTAREDLAEIGGTAWVMHHDTSGARLLFLQNDDENKAFSIAFKTPPGNDTGVFHILEHSVLCGSDRFPVKEPFVNLLKSSMQTFLNAMTFPDKTMYPVASTNEQDLLNLMDVYLDAVFHPAIYHKREIFQQEGWHYELAGTPDTPQLIHNGVVFNEMKGALSSPQNVLFDVLQTALFPDTAYRFESGGTPEGIPELTYEAFLDEHRAHYRTDNSSIVLYGDLDIDRILSFLDERYLEPLAQQDGKCDDSLVAGTPLAPRELDIQAPVVADDIVHEMTTAPENACCALGYVVGTAADREKIYAVDILLDALLGSNEAPLKRALLDAELGDDISNTLADSMLQPFAVVALKGAKPDVLPHFRQTTENAVRDILEKGIDPRLIEACISHTEFVLREYDFGMSDGVALAMSAMSGWLYGEDDALATAYIRYEDVLADLRKQIGTSYFDDLAREVFLECPHRASVEIKPVEAVSPTAEETHLARVLDSLDAAELEGIGQQVEALRAAQERPDSPEALATLPSLRVRDIGLAKPRPGYHVVPQTSFPCIHHEVGTRGLAYARRFYDVRCLSFEEMPYLSVLCLLLGKLDTARHTAAELDTLVQARLGDLVFFGEAHRPDVPTVLGSQDELLPQFVMSASSLEENVHDLCAIPSEIMFETDFSNTAKIKSILQQHRFALEQQFAGAGHTAARRRSTSYYSYEGVLGEALFGVDFYLFLKELLAHYDERADALSAKLKNITKRILVRSGLTVGFAGSEAALESYLSAMEPEVQQEQAAQQELRAQAAAKVGLCDESQNGMQGESQNGPQDESQNGPQAAAQTGSQAAAQANSQGGPSSAADLEAQAAARHGLQTSLQAVAHDDSQGGLQTGSQAAAQANSQGGSLSAADLEAQAAAQRNTGEAETQNGTGAEQPGVARALVIPDPVARNEAFIVPSDVGYTGQTFNLQYSKDFAYVPFDSAWSVASRALSFDYLWTEVRVKGGAYGAGFAANRRGSLSFYSYRDPNIDATIDRFAGAPAWLEAFDPTQEEMEGYIVSTASTFDAPLKARALSLSQMNDYFSGRTQDWRIAARAQVLAATPDTIRSFATSIKHALSHEAICVFGGRDVIEKSERNFQIIDLFDADRP